MEGQPESMYSVIGGDGQVYGPVDVQTLQRWCAEGRVAPTTMLIDAVSGQQLPASLAPNLSGYFTIQNVPQPYMPPAAPQSNYYRGYPTAMGGRSSKSKVVAILLAFFLGIFGAHRFYLGHIRSGLAMLALTACTILLCGGGAFLTFIWAIIDLILIATDSLTDISGQKLS